MKAKPRHRLISELTYPVDGAERTVTAGTVVDDLPKSSLQWLIAQGHVTEEPDDTLEA